MDWHEWKTMVAYKCPLCDKYYAKPWSHLCKKDTSLIQCGLCKHHYIGTYMNEGVDYYDPPEYGGACHSCRRGHNNNTPRMRECKDYEALPEEPFDPNETIQDTWARTEEQNKRWKI